MPAQSEDGRVGAFITHRHGRVTSPAIHALRRGGKDVDARSKAGHDGFGPVIDPKTAEKSLHFLVISRLWG
jgi:hypothetical protein